MKKSVHTWTYDPVLTEKKTSLHKHKMGARDSMLGYLILTRLSLLFTWIKAEFPVSFL